MFKAGILCLLLVQHSTGINKHKYVAQSTAKVWYISAAVNQAKLLRILDDLKQSQNEATLVFCDNQTLMAENLCFIMEPST